MVVVGVVVVVAVVVGVAVAVAVAVVVVVGVGVGVAVAVAVVAMTCTNCRRPLDTRRSTFETRDDHGHRQHFCSLTCIYQHINPPISKESAHENR